MNFLLYFYYFCFTSWDQYFSSKIPINDVYKHQKYSSQESSLSPNNGNTYVFNCFFSNMSSDYGAAIFYITNSNFLIEKSIFINCRVQNDTAAVRITGGNIIIAFVCGNNNKAYNDGFCAIHSDTNREINSVYDSSVSFCEALQANIMFHSYGYVYFSSVNLSYNKAEYQSALTWKPRLVNSETKRGSDVLYCLFSNNSATIDQCLRLNNEYNTECKHQIKKSNVISNKGKNLINCIGETDLIACYIKENKNQPVFSGNITLFNCCVSEDQYSGSTPKIALTGSTFINSFTLIRSNDCHIVFENSLMAFYPIIIRRLLMKNTFIFFFILS